MLRAIAALYQGRAGRGCWRPDAGLVATESTDVFANTVGSWGAGAVAGRGSSSATQVPASRSGGGLGYVDHFPQATAALMGYDMQTGGTEYAAMRQQQRVAAGLAQRIIAATAPPSLGTESVGRQFTYVGGPNDGDRSGETFNPNPYFYNRDSQTIDYYELAPGSAQAVLRTDPLRTGILDKGLSELNTEILRAGLAPADIGMGGYNIVTGNGGLRDYLAVAGVVPAGKMLEAFGRGTESGIAQAARLGREGEVAAGIRGSKVGVFVNGRIRFPDEITLTAVREIKNVARQGWTRQLRAYADLARSEGKTFELWVRENTRLSGPLRAARDRGEVIIRPELIGR